MIGQFTANELFQIEDAVNEQVKQITHKAFLQEQRLMLENGEALPEPESLPYFIKHLRLDVVETLMASN